MREIKFRGKRKDNGEWVYGYYVRKLKAIVGSDELVNIDYIYMWVTGKYFEVHPETVGQYTELKDKNGKEIYKGDIIKYIDPWGRKEVNHIEGEVIFGNSKYSIHCQGADEEQGYNGWLIKNEFGVKPLVKDSCQEVIDNIYENPELKKEVL